MRLRQRQYIERLIFNHRLYPTLPAFGNRPGAGGAGKAVGAALAGWGKATARVGALATAIVATAIVAPPLRAGDAPIELILPDVTPAPPLRDRLYAFSGVDVARDSRFLWAGLVGAVRGRLHQDGPRLRVMGGVGRYRYRSHTLPGGFNDVQSVSGEFMLGYRRAYGPAEVTVYLGAHMEDNQLELPDPSHRTQGNATGIKAAAELYRRLSENWYADLSASASTVHWRYHARGTVAHEYRRALTVGVETALHGDARYVEQRVGFFTQTFHRRAALRLSGGYLSNSDKGTGPYATVTFYVPY